MEPSATWPAAWPTTSTNLLTALIGYGNILKMKLPADDPSRARGQVILVSRKAADLTRGLLAFSRKQIINPLPADLNEIVQGMGRILQRIIVNGSASRSTCGAAANVLVDRGQIDRCS